MVIFDINLSKTRLILANNSFRIISFVNNKNNQKNSIFKVIYKSSNQIPKIK